MLRQGLGMCHLPPGRVLQLRIHFCCVSPPCLAFVVGRGLWSKVMFNECLRGCSDVLPNGLGEFFQGWHLQLRDGKGARKSCVMQLRELK